MENIRVYGVDLDLIPNKETIRKIVDFELSDKEFIDLAELQGFIWSIKGFEHDYNIDHLNTQLFIRFI
jgi:hypothetical protein